MYVGFALLLHPLLVKVTFHCKWAFWWSISNHSWRRPKRFNFTSSSNPILVSLGPRCSLCHLGNRRQYPEWPKYFLSGEENNFRKYDRSLIDSLGTPYDYRSVMHYGDKAFSKNGLPTILVKQPGVCYYKQSKLRWIEMFLAGPYYPPLSPSMFSSMFSIYVLWYQVGGLD